MLTKISRMNARDVSRCWHFPQNVPEFKIYSEHLVYDAFYSFCSQLQAKTTEQPQL